MKIRAFILVSFLVATLIAVFIYSTNQEKNLDKETLSAVLEDSGDEEKPKRWISDSPTPTPGSWSKDSYVIAVYGDSMVDTMGERLEYLEHELARKYPKTKFTLYNYGIGGENVEMGLSRWKKEFHNRDRDYPSITQVKPDIIILGSFSYNTFDPHNRNRHIIGLRKLVAEARKITPDVYLMVEMAPLADKFGSGPNGPNMPPKAALEQSDRIMEQLDDSLEIASELDLPLINTYAASQINGKYGERAYVDLSDGIHPSIEGHEFFAREIVKALAPK